LIIIRDSDAYIFDLKKLLKQKCWKFKFN
jgi:hypothetical protein